MAMAPETTETKIHPGQGSQLPEQPGPLNTLVQSLGLEQLDLTMLSSAAEGGENVQLVGLSKAIDALAQDIANKFGALSERLNALEANRRQQLAPQVLNGHNLTVVNTSTPAPEAWRGSVSETPIGPTGPQPGTERLLWADRPVDETPDYEQ